MPEAAYLAVLPKAPTNYDPVRATDRALDRRNYVLREMANNGYITEAQRAAAAAAPLGTIRYGSNAKFRDGRLFHGGSPPRPDQAVRREGRGRARTASMPAACGCARSMVPVMQDAAAEALREGLAKFDGGRGWRDTGLSVDVDGDWQTQLRVAALGTGFPDWKKAVVLDKSGGERADRLSRRLDRHPARLGRAASRSAAAAAARSPACGPA